MKTLALASLLATVATVGFAEPVKYNLDPSHSQVMFHYSHLGFSTTYGLFSGFDGEIMFDKEDPAASSVTVTIPVNSLLTGWDARFEHFMTDDFFGAEANPLATFTSTGIEVTGEKTGKITGDLTINGITKPLVLDAVLNQTGPHPQAGTEWAGFSATGTILRSDYDMGAFVPYVSDEVELNISIEAGKAE